jgi:hypothetical protein
MSGLGNGDEDWNDCTFAIKFSTGTLTSSSSMNVVPEVAAPPVEMRRMVTPG